MICTQQQIIWSFPRNLQHWIRTVFGYVLLGVVSTFDGGKLLQFPVLAEVESWWTLSTLLLYNLWPTWVLNFVELSGRWSAVARTLAGCLLGLGKKTQCSESKWAHYPILCNFTTFGHRRSASSAFSWKTQSKKQNNATDKKKAILLVRGRGNTHSGEHFIGETFGYTHQGEKSHQYFWSASSEEKDFEF